MWKAFKKDKKSTVLVEQHELVKTFLRYLMRRSNQLHLPGDVETYLLVKEILQESYSNRPRSASLSRVQNVCPFTGRTRGYYNFAKLSRMRFKHLAGAGVLPGFRKASW